MTCILRKSFFPTLALLTLGASVHAQTVITTIPANSSIQTGFSTIGQTFTTPSANVLTSFAFQLGNTTPLTFALYAYNPTTNATIGSALFTSAPTVNSTVQGQNGYTFNTGNLVLTTGAVYAALLSGGVPDASGYAYNGPIATGPPDAYTGGTLIGANNPSGSFSNFSTLFNFPIDGAFRATFTTAAVPEPGSVALLTGISMTGAGFLVRRRKSVHKAA